jgi:hypothetical protein
VASQGGRKKFRFKNKLMSLDGSIIELSVSMFDWWAKRRTIQRHLKALRRLGCQVPHEPASATAAPGV